MKANFSYLGCMENLTMTKLKKLPKNRPTCVGIGLVALDVILNGSPLTPAKLCAGGSCGNVMSILSYLGWDSKPIARLSTNNATKKILVDFKNFNVNTNLLFKESSGSTPIIIHRILKDKDGKPKHKFEFKIPGTDKWLPGYKPLLATKVETITKKQNNTSVFYLDRVSRSSIDLAKYYKSLGALIVFEPSSFKEDKQFLECLSITDILKFSSERIKNFSELFPEPIVPLEIETLGEKGLQYRLKADSKKGWKVLKSYKLKNVIDTAGAGDWCTAGIINELGQKGAKSVDFSNRLIIENSLNIGQALGALNSIFEGARGLMYNFDYKTLNDSVSKIILKHEINKTFTKNNTKINTIVNLDFNILLNNLY